MFKTLIIIPTFNESESIPILLSSILNLYGETVDVLVVDDDSPDGTSEIVNNISNNHSNIKIITKQEDKGFSKAYITGFQYALENEYEAVMQMDADGSHQPVYIKEMLNSLESGCDYVIGSRWVKGGGVINWPLKRKILSIGGNIYSRIMLRSKINDITGGFKAIKAELLQKMTTSTISTTGYSFQIELYLRARSLDAKICEVPIQFVERVHGASKMSMAIVKEAIKYVTVKGLTSFGRSKNHNKH